MNRVIKFRGIIKYPDDIFRGFWYGNLVIYANGDTFIRQIETGQEFEVIPETVGQFAGLTDKNGKEIYECDVLSNSFMNNKKGKKGIITFKEHCFCVECEELYRPIGNDLGWSNMKENKWYGEMEVIGSIHDNPELIQQP